MKIIVPLLCNRFLFCISLVLCLVSCSVSKYAKAYKDLSKDESKSEIESLQIQMSYYKVEYYLNKISEGKSLYSLATIADKKIQIIMEYAPNDLEFKNKWKTAVDDFIKYENENSPELKSHKKENYKARFDTKEERDSYYKIYNKLTEELKYTNLDSYNFFHNNLDENLNNTWLNRGSFLLEYYKTKGLIIPANWINYKDLQNINKEYEYIALFDRIKYINNKINKS